MQNALSLTDAALNQLTKLCQEKQHKGLYIDIKRTGCSGYAYDLTTVNQTQAEDIIFPQENGLFVAISKKNLEFIKGSTLDYVREKMNARFKFLNPNEKGSCGCGESFTV
jgi:iron-sulfur cluster assembly protein